MRAALLAVVVSIGCTKSNTVQCGGVTCPAGTHCGESTTCVPDGCGDGTVDDLEECDGDDSIPHETLRCTDYGFYLGPALTCSDSCAIDTSACRDYCGDHIVNGLERCDGIPATGFACTDFGFDVGTISCNNACTPGFDFCSNIGWQLVPGGATNELLAVYLAASSSGVAVGKGGEIIAANDGIWLPVTQTETTEDLNGIAGSAGAIIAVGNKGTILRYDGTTVTKMASPTTADLNDVSGVLADAIAVGDGGTILRYDGTTWTAMTSPTVVDLYGVHVVNATTAYAVGNGNTVLKLDGSVWTDLTPDLTWTPSSPPATGTITWFSVFVVDGAVFVAGNESTIARIVNDSLGVVPTRPADIAVDYELRAVWGTSPNDLFVSGQNGLVLHWDGLYLTVQDTPTNRTIYGLDGADGRLVGVTRGGSVIAFNGTSRHVSAPTASELFAIHTDGTRVVAAGRSLASLLPNGRWETVDTIPTARSVFVLDNRIFVGSQLQGLYRYNRLNLAEAPLLVSASGVNGVGATASLVVAVGDKVIESDPSADVFPTTTSTTVHEPATLRGVWSAPDGIWFAVGADGTAIRRGLDGTWAAIPTGVSDALLAVWGAASDDVFAVGTTGTILHWNGTTWRRMYTGVAENLVSISGNSRSDITVTGTSYTRLHYDGISWSRMSSYGLDTPSVSSGAGTTWYVSGANIERSDQTLATQETRCGDPFDNDRDGSNNCDDPDCKEAGQCRTGGACLTLERVTCETADLATSTFTGVARLNDLPCLDHSTPGPEASYRYVAETSGTVTITITDATAQLDLVVTDATFGHCNLDNCQPAVVGEGTKSATFTATAGQMYYIVVDGPVGIGTSFTLTVDCS